MKLGLAIGYSGAHLDVPVALVQRAEELGYDSVWSAEAYGSDAITPLAFLAAKTNRIKLGTGIMQLAARTPANAAMSAASIDPMAGGGRFIAGLDVSGPQIVEGWYRQPWGRPYYRAARLRRRRQAHPGTVPRGPQGLSHRHRARRVGRSEIAGRSTGAHPRTLPRLGGQRR